MKLRNLPFRILTLLIVVFFAFPQVLLAANTGVLKTLKKTSSPINIYHVIQSPENFEKLPAKLSDGYLMIFSKQFPNSNGASTIVKKQPILTAADILGIWTEKRKKPNSGKQTSICLTEDGGQRFAAFSLENTFARIALALDGRIIALPMLEGTIFGGVIGITPGLPLITVQKMQSRFQDFNSMHADWPVATDMSLAINCSDENVEIRALSYLTNAIESEPKNATLYSLRENNFEIKGDLQKALADYSRSIFINPKDTFTYFERSEIYVKLRKFKKAMADFNQVVVLQPQMDGLSVLKGQIYQGLGKFEQAIVEFSKVIKKFPSLSGGYEMRALSYLDNNQLGLSLKDSSEAIKFEPSARNFQTQEWILYKMRRFEKALVKVNKAISLDNLDDFSFDTRGLIYEALGQKVKAVTDFRQALKLNPQNQESKASLKSLGFKN